MPIKTRSALVRKATEPTEDVDKQNNIKKRKLEEQETIQSDEVVAAVINTVNKRKRVMSKIEIKNPKKNKRRKRNEQEIQESFNEEEEKDRFSRLPESLRLHILSSLDAKSAVQTSVLSKSFKTSWASAPVLNFHSNNCSKRTELRVFDKFVQTVLSKRDRSVSLEKISFIIRGEKRSAKMLNSVFGYALSHGVKGFEAEINTSTKESDIVWPDFLENNDTTKTNISTDSLTSLILKGSKLWYPGCLFLRPQRATSAAGLIFKNLRVLYVKRGYIEYREPNFGGFPFLEKLTLIDCRVPAIHLNINSLNLSELSILHDRHCGRVPLFLNLTTPKLKFFKFRSPMFPFSFETHTELPFLETVVLDDPTNIATYSKYNVERIEKDLLQAVCNVYSSFAVFDSVVMQLSLFKDSWLYKDSSLYEKLKLDLKHNLQDRESFLDNTIGWLSESLERRPLIDQFSCSVIMRV